jgi:hypothetical protein
MIEENFCLTYPHPVDYTALLPFLVIIIKI